MSAEDNQTIKYFLYTRKSTDDERQVLSLKSQKEESQKRFFNLKTTELEPESVSAHKPYKRPVFKEMIERLQNGEAQGIIAWHPDRLSRNPIDAAQIIYLLDTGVIKDLKFCSYGFENTPEGKMMLAMTMSQSKYSSDKLSTDVKRGVKNKAHTGQRPALAPLGYLNSKTKLKGEQEIYSDSLRFPLVKQLWAYMLTSNYSAPQLYKIAIKEMHLTQPATPNRPERPIRLNALYRMFTNTFYYGWYEWTDGSLIQGKHVPMITEEEFYRVQKILGRKGKPRPKQRQRFAFTGLVRCGNCGAAVTAEEKIKRQKNGNIHYYTYYRCTKKIDPNCTEKAVRLEKFSQQVDALITRLSISEKSLHWAIKCLHEMRTDEASGREASLESHQKEYERTVKQIDSLHLKYISPENTDGKLFSDTE